MKIKYGVIQIYIACIGVLFLIVGLITSLDNSDIYSGWATKNTIKAQTSYSSVSSINPNIDTQTSKKTGTNGIIGLPNNLNSKEFLIDFIDNNLRDGYILELKDVPILKKKAEFEINLRDLKTKLRKLKTDLENIEKSRNTALINSKKLAIENLQNKIAKEENNAKIKVKSYRDTILNKKELQKRDLELILKDSQKIELEYNDVFNGFFINNITPSEIEQIKKLDFIKKVHQNRHVKLTLYDSVPLVNADDVWNLGYTGEGITIGIIDTGVDYTHPDLCYSHPVKLYVWPGDTNNDGVVDDRDSDTISKYFGYRGYPRDDGGDVSWKEHIVSGWDSISTTYADANGDGKVDQADVLVVGLNYGLTHNIENLCNKVVGGYDFLNKDDDPMDDHGHGTHVAGIAAGNGILKGIAPDSMIYSYKTMNQFGGSTSDIVSAIEMAVDPNRDGNYSDHLDIISMSLGDLYGTPDDPMSQATDNAVSNGVVAVAAAGNDGPEGFTIHSPGSARSAIAVGASDKTDLIADLSSRGPSPILAVKPDVTAPGVDICSAQYGAYKDANKCIDDMHILNKGTSMATPHVSGAVALILQKYPDIQPNEVKSLLSNTAIDIGYGVFTQGSGRIDVLKAINTDTLILPSNLQLKINTATNKSDLPISFQIRKLSSTPHTYTISSNIENSDIIVEVNPSIINDNDNSLVLKLKTKDGSNIPNGVIGGVILFKEDTSQNILRVPYSLVIDDTPPIITILGRRDILNGNVLTQYFSWTTNEDADSTFYYREYGTTQFLEKKSKGTVHEVNIDGLVDGVYEYYLSAVNFVGSKTVDNNQGKYYTFRKTPTLIVPESGFNRIHSLPPTNLILTKKPEIDLDNDGKKEIILNENEPWPTAYYVYENNGSNNYALVSTTDLIGDLITPSDSGDSDKDGKKEVLLHTYYDSMRYIKIYESTSPDTYPSQKTFELPVPTGSYQISDAKYSDLDVDGKTEIVITIAEKPMLYMYENVGDNAFAKIFEKEYKEIDGIKSMSIADDIDGDGKKELILGGYNYTTSRIYIIENLGDNSFQQIWSEQLTDIDRKVYPKVFYLGDLDRDGRKEFIAGGVRYSLPLETDSYSFYKIYENSGDNMFNEIWSIKIKDDNPSVYPTPPIGIGDINGDGLNELIIQVDLNLYIFENKGDNMFEPIWHGISSNYNSNSIGVGDYNNNQRDEIIINDIDVTTIYERLPQIDKLIRRY